ncbi:dihydroorotate dehydrogenase [Gnomoniopsis smithogilvyi]|uniref:Dihydroorotate dehydrogenase (fumarate) n=1 Tax=Gnomoniopsis smithogilvyi TaxID=1191159 RepID=A0A9W8Z1G2_9PEZI|nr:dihydroorotate dehydrogenase [Gnomoniopsis smithogilvyi]
MSATLPPKLNINPPLINSSNPWATTLEDLTALYSCPHTGAVTTRTSLLTGFAHNPSTHQFTLFDVATHKSQQDRTELSGHENASLNTLGYSPLALESYLGFIKTIAASPTARPDKGFIISVTGSPEDVADCYRAISETATLVPFPLAMEVNLSCPNIPGKPPPAYDGSALLQYLNAIQGALTHPYGPQIPCGLKTPPYTHANEYTELFKALEASSSDSAPCPISFITATNTLGSCLLLADPEATTDTIPALPAAGIGGMAGAPLHPLALGNVRTIRRMLDERKEALGHVQIIGVGGVLDSAGFRRMRGVGADFVGVGTGLGLKGVDVFGDISTR